MIIDIVKDWVRKSIEEVPDNSAKRIPSQQQVDAVLKIWSLKDIPLPNLSDIIKSHKLVDRLSLGDFLISKSFTNMGNVKEYSSDKPKQEYQRGLSAFLSGDSDEENSSNLHLVSLLHTTQEVTLHICRCQSLMNITRNMESTILSWISYQKSELLEKLIDNKYLVSRDHIAIAKEIELRKKQYPNDKIYLFIDRHLVNVFNAWEPETIRWHGAYVIELSEGYCRNMPEYSSAVVADSQICTSMKIDSFTKSVRNKTNWDVGKIVAPHWNIKVLPLNEEVIVIRNQTTLF